MPYIGKQPLTGAYQLCDAITTSATATYNLTVGGSAVIPGSAQNCIVSLNGVIQAPVTAFTVSGSQITFSSALTSTDVIDFILILGNVFDIGTPTNGSVTNSSLNSNVITGQTAVTVPATDDVLLCYDTSATALRKITFANFGNAPAFEAYLQSNQTISSATSTKVQFNTEVYDTNSAYDNATNYRFTPQVAGKYFVYSFTRLFETGFGLLLRRASISIFKNGAEYSNVYWDYESGSSNLIRFMTPTITNDISLNGTSDYLEIFVVITTDGGTNGKVGGYTDAGNFIVSTFGAYRLIGV